MHHLSGALGRRGADGAERPWQTIKKGASRPSSAQQRRAPAPCRESRVAVFRCCPAPCPAPTPQTAYLVATVKPVQEQRGQYRSYSDSRSPGFGLAAPVLHSWRGINARGLLHSGAPGRWVGAARCRCVLESPAVADGREGANHAPHKPITQVPKALSPLAVPAERRYLRGEVLAPSIAGSPAECVYVGRIYRMDTTLQSSRPSGCRSRRRRRQTAMDCLVPAGQARPCRRRHH